MDDWSDLINLFFIGCCGRQRLQDWELIVSSGSHLIWFLQPKPEPFSYTCHHFLLSTIQKSFSVRTVSPWTAWFPAMVEQRLGRRPLQVDESCTKLMRRNVGIGMNEGRHRLQSSIASLRKTHPSLPVRPWPFSIPSTNSWSKGTGSASTQPCILARLAMFFWHFSAMYFKMC